MDAPKALIQKYVDKGYKKSRNKGGVIEDRIQADYLAMIDYLDQSIGVLMEGIKKLQLPRETLVIFMSDKGKPSAFKNEEALGAIVAKACAENPDERYFVSEGSKIETNTPIIANTINNSIRVKNLLIT